MSPMWWMGIPGWRFMDAALAFTKAGFYSDNELGMLYGGAGSSSGVLGALDEIVAY